MKLLFLTENYPPNRGGMAQSCDRLVGSLRANDFIVDVLHFSNRSQPFNTVEKVNGNYTSVPKHQDIAHGLNLALSFVEHHLDVSEYDAMIAFGGLFPMSAAPIFSKILELPMFLCLRGNDFDISLFNFKRRTILTDAVEQASGVFVGSKGKLERLTKLYPSVNTHYSPSGIDLLDWQAFASEEVFAKKWRDATLISKQRVIGLLGYLKEKKGVRFFINALLKSMCKDKIHLLLSGGQEPDLIEFMQSHGIHFTLLPFLDRVELVKYYRVCDWLAIPSFYEGMPNVMLEAGGLGIPILASNVDGMKDLLEHNQTGLLFTPLDQVDCARKISYLTNLSETARLQMGAKLKTTIANNYSVQQEIENYINILRPSKSINLSILNTQ